MLCIAFFPYIFEGKIFLPTDMFDTMTAPFNAHYGPPQAQNFYPFDGIVQTYPYKVETQEALRRGHLAYWNPHILCGYPQYAETMGSNFDVFNVVGLWLDPWHTILAEVLLEFFVAGAGMCLLLRFFGVQPGVNLMFSAAYMLNSLFVAGAMPRWAAASFCWMPFVVLMLVRRYRYGRREDLVYASLFLVLSYLGGNLQSAFFTTCVVACIVLFYPSTDDSIQWLGRVGMLAAVLFVAILLSASMWLPTVQLLIQTLEGGSLNSSSVYAKYSVMQRILSIPLLLSFYFPALAGSPAVFNLKKIAGADMTDFNGAIAFVPMLFAVWGCVVLRKRKELLPFVVLAGSAIILPLLTPLYSVLYHRVFIIATFCFSIVGAVMFQAFVDRRIDRATVARAIGRIRMAFGAFILALVVICAYTTLQRDALAERLTGMLKSSVLHSAFGSSTEAWLLARVGNTLNYYSFFSMGLWLPVVLALVTLVAIYQFAAGKLGARALVGIAGAATFIQLVLFVRVWLPAIDPDTFPMYPVSTVTTFLHTHSVQGRYMVWQDPAKDTYILHPNIATVYGMNDFDGYESLTPGTMSVFYHRRIAPDSLDLRLLGLSNVRYVVTRSRVISDPDARPVLTAEGLTIYENLRAKPRAYLAAGVRVLASDSAVTGKLLQSDCDGSEALLNRKDAPSNLEGHYASTGDIQVREAGNEEVSIQAMVPSKAFLVLTDTYYPGWTCSVNGAPRPIYRVDGYMRGVMLEAGKSVILFRFEPGLFTAGIGLSGLAAAFALSAIGYLKRRRARNQPSEI